MRIGIDVGGTNLSAGIVDWGGKILHKKTQKTNASGGLEAIINDIARICDSLAEESGHDLLHIISVGIGWPGSADSARGLVIKSPNLKIYNEIVTQPLSQVLGLPVHLENDANCAALAEHKYGAAMGAKSSITITFGTGVGGGIILDGKIYAGPFFGAGELGHHIIMMNGQTCGCGRNGCWEAYASAGALRRMGERAADKLNIKEKINAKSIFRAAKAGNAAAAMLVDEYMDYVCEGLANITNIFQPEIIVIGGGLSGEGESLILDINKRVQPKLFDTRNLTKFKLAKLGNDAGIIGAAMLGDG